MFVCILATIFDFAIEILVSHRLILKIFICKLKKQNGSSAELIISSYLGWTCLMLIFFFSLFLQMGRYKL